MLNLFSWVSLDSGTTRYYKSKQFGQATSWFEAFSYCKIMGMDLYSPKTNKINQSFMTSLLPVNATVIPVGITNLGTEIFWYSTKTGLEFDYTVSEKNQGCMFLFPNNPNNELQSSVCTGSSEYFICESDN